MAENHVQRRLAAILAADVAGYTRLMEQDEAGTLAMLRARRKELLEPLVARYHGRVFKITGDGVLVEFGSAVNAVQCAVELQHGMAAANAKLPEDRRLVWRIGVNLGDVMIEGGDLYGDGVNVSARLEAMAEPGTVLISGTTFDYIRNKVDAQFEDLGTHALKNLDAPVRVYRAAGTPRVSVTKTKSVADKPSIAVLPFVNMSDDVGQQYFSDGVTEDIITELSRFRSLFVIARTSSFAFRGQGIEVDEIARKLGVQYVVEGSVRRAGDQVRITAQLIDATNGAHLWAERFDRELKDIFAVQDEVVRTVVATVAGRVEAADAQLAKRKPPESLVAYDYVLRGLEHLNRVGDDQNAEARRLFQKAVELDPQYAAGHAYLALAIYVQWQDNRDPGELDRALGSARRALALDENDSRSHRILSVVYGHLRQYDRSEFHSDRSIALNPNDAIGALYRAGRLRHLGRAEEGIEWAHKAMRLNPYHPNWWWDALAHVLHTAGRYPEALEAYSRVVERPSFYHAYVAACHAELGQLEEARSHAALALQTKPDFSVSAWGKRLPFKYDADLQRFLDGLRKAGLPE